MSRLADNVPAGSPPPAQKTGGVLTPERGVALIVVLCLAFLVFARAYFRQFVPR